MRPFLLLQRLITMIGDDPSIVLQEQKLTKRQIQYFSTIERYNNIFPGNNTIMRTLDESTFTTEIKQFNPQSCVQGFTGNIYRRIINTLQQSAKNSPQKRHIYQRYHLLSTMHETRIIHSLV